MNKRRSTGASERPFADLPAALVDEVLERTEEVGQGLMDSFHKVREKRETWRNQLDAAGLLRHESELEYVPIPTTCGIDGSYAIERLLSTDLVAAASVAVEGLTPPSETRHWPEPQHRVIVKSEPHNADTGTIARAIMIGMELDLAVEAPHEVVFLDGSLTTPVIYLNQALSKSRDLQHLQIAAYLQKHVTGFLKAYETVLASRRSDRSWVAVPKYTTRREIGRMLNWSQSHDDRGLLTSILSPGEFTAPQRLQPPDQEWHLNLGTVPSSDIAQAERAKDLVVDLLDEIRVIYYRPCPWLPALRLEMSRAIAQTSARLAAVVHAVRHQCGTAAVMEPYPLYMADRMVKHLARAIPTFRQVTSQRVAEVYEGKIDDVFLGLHGYRTESGR
jgi:hypothetical protein